MKKMSLVEHKFVFNWENVRIIRCECLSETLRWLVTGEMVAGDGGGDGGDAATQPDNAAIEMTVQNQDFENSGNVKMH